MKAIGVMQFGGPSALEVVELPEPHAATGVVIKQVVRMKTSPFQYVINY